MRQIAASPRGVDAIDSGASVRHYPGVYASPWPTLWTGAASSLAASLDGTYVLTAQGTVMRIKLGSASIWRTSAEPTLTSIHAGLTSDVFAISGGRPFRLTRDAEQPLLCSGPAKSIVAVGTDAYVLNHDGSVDREGNGRCERLPLPAKVDSIAVNQQAFYFLAGGTVYEKRGDRITKLPDPDVFRATGRHTTKVAIISASERTLWAQTSAGFVFQLVTP